MSTHTQFFWPLTDGRVFAEPDNSIIDLDTALARGLTCASKNMLRIERDREIAGNNSLAEYLAGQGTTFDYDFDVAPHKAKFEESQRQKAEAAKPPKTERQKALAARKAPPAAIAAPPPSQALSTWAAAIVESEEAILRPDATATLLEIHSENTLSVAMATAMLGALPIEHYNFSQPTTEDQMSTLNATAALVRAAELRQSALTLRGQRGDAAAHDEANKLRVALHNHHSAGVDIVAALQGAGANVASVAELAKRAA